MASQKNHGQLNVLQGAHRGQKVECLEDEADMSQSQTGEERVGRVLVNTVSHDEKLAAGWGIDGADQVEHRGLTATRWTSDHDEFTPT